MNMHHEHHHASHHQDHSEDHTQTDMRDAAAGETGDRNSTLDELEKMMFERAR